MSEKLLDELARAACLAHQPASVWDRLGQPARQRFRDQCVAVVQKILGRLNERRAELIRQEVSEGLGERARGELEAYQQITFDLMNAVDPRPSLVGPALPTALEDVKKKLCHEFDSSGTCNYCYLSAEQLASPGGGDPGRLECGVRRRMEG